ncbi:MAG: LLM class F420-dependent oxidoreductase, partial [Chloroflexi bacterium]|nr:LLM class F420-dependent oxidoreductase [Chloroflexota bacterium]
AIWVPETWGFDAVTLLGYLAAKTERVQLGAGILPIYTRTPTLIAQTAAALDYLSDGRAILGLGSSGPQVIEGWHGVPFDRPVARLREIVDISRRVWRREPIDLQGDCYQLPLPAHRGTGLGKRLKLLAHPLRSAIPIYLATLGARGVALAAEVADGWLPIFYVPEKAAAVWGEPLARGRARRSAELGPLEIVAGGLCAIGEDVARLRDEARPDIALYVGGMGARGRNFYVDLMERYGYGDAAQQIQELFLRRERLAAAAAVPSELLASTTLIGPENYVRERIAAYRESGVTMLNVQPVGPTPPRQTLEHLRELVATS